MRAAFSTIILFALWASAPGFAQPAGAPKDETFSRNRKFSVEISAADLDRPLLAVLDHSQDRPVLLWSRPLLPEGADAEQFKMSYHEYTYRKFVSDDGSFVLLRLRDFNPGLAPIRLIKQKAERSFDEGDLSSALDNELEDESGLLQRGLFEVFLPSERIFGLWMMTSKQWLVVNVDQPGLQKPAPTEIKRLNEAGLLQAREFAREYRPSGLRRALNTLRLRASAVLPASNTPSDPPMEGVVEPTYAFLAWMKQPEDRALIESLLDSPLQVAAWLDGSYGSGDPVVSLVSADRIIAARLLDEWDGRKMDDNDVLDAMGDAFGTQKMTRFSSVSGKVYLPFVPPPDAGGVSVYLIPDHLRPNQWQNDDSVLQLTYTPENMPRFPGQPGGFTSASFNFSFSTIPPGKYRLKAVWDRRVAGKPASQVVIPNDGDYESVESTNLSLTVSQSLSGMEIFCTNRVGNSEAFMLEDEKWAQENPSVAKDPTAERVQRPTEKRKALVDVPLANWLVRTNEGPAEVTLTRIGIIEKNGEAGVAKPTFVVRFRAKSKRKTGQQSTLQAQVQDDHGCKFDSIGYSQSGGIFQMEFAVFPFATKQFTMRFYRQDFADDSGRSYQNGPRNTELASFSLQNVSGLKPREWKSDSLPAKRSLDLVDVELTAFDPRASEFPVQMPFGAPGFDYPVVSRSNGAPKNTFAFSKGGKLARGWRKDSAYFVDRWGNQSRGLTGFCQEEELFQYIVEFARDPEKASFADDEKFELHIPKIPGAGESMKVNTIHSVQGLSFRLFAIGGTGEFTYDQGKLISAKEEAGENDYIPDRTFPGRRFDPKLRLVQSGTTGVPYGMPGAPQGPVTIVSKVPHLVCRIAPPPPGTLFAVLEQDTSVPDPLVAARSRFGPYEQFSATRRPIEFLALNYRPEETDKKLTVIVQKTRQAEFYVKAASEDRARPGF